LETRDALGVWELSDNLEIEISEDSELLAIEVPMH
jgi:hypothetical protein